MEQYKRNHLIARIISGALIYKKIMICSPSREHRYISEIIYTKSYEKSIDQGLHSEDSLLEWMKLEGYWTEQEEAILEGIEKDVDSLKVGLFESGLILSSSKKIKQTLNNAKLKFKEYYSSKHRYDHLTAGYVANLAKINYLVKNSLRTTDGHPIRRNNVSSIIDFMFENKIRDEDFRELARSEPWTGVYSLSDSPLGTASVDMTDEQKSLLCWSMLYSNVRKHQECPSDIIINDDDALDGWLIVQKKKRDDEVKKVKVDDLITNEKIRNSEEIFIMVDNPEDAKIVEDMNDPLSAMRKKQRMSYLSSKGGQVNEMEMPDVKQRVSMEIARLQSKGQ